MVQGNLFITGAKLTKTNYITLINSCRNTHGLGANNRLNIKVRALTSSGTDEYEDINTFLVSGTGTVTLYTDTPFFGRCGHNFRHRI